MKRTIEISMVLRATLPVPAPLAAPVGRLRGTLGSTFENLVRDYSASPPGRHP